MRDVTIIVVFCFKQKTAYEMRIRDWSSDVCSSDLLFIRGAGDGAFFLVATLQDLPRRPHASGAAASRMPLLPNDDEVMTLIIHPKVRGFICTTTHPLGCEHNVSEQIAATRAQGVRADGPKKVLVIGASSGYGLAARITAAFGFGADTLGVFFEKPGSDKKAGKIGRAHV